MNYFTKFPHSLYNITRKSIWYYVDKLKLEVRRKKEQKNTLMYRRTDKMYNLCIIDTFVIDLIALYKVIILTK